MARSKKVTFAIIGIPLIVLGAGAYFGSDSVVVY